MNDGYKGTEFEWWYFHFLSDMKFNIIVHPTDMYGLKKMSYISISILEESGKGINFKQAFDLEKTSLSDNKLSIENNMFYIEERTDMILMRLLLEDIKVNIRINKIITPEPFDENSAILYNEAENLNNNWMLAVPHSEFCGTLQYFDKNVKLRGRAYHDHNWGNWLIQKCYDYWLWGNFQNNDYAITYYYLIGGKGGRVKLLNMVFQDKSMNLTDFDILDLNGKTEILFNTKTRKYSLTVNNQNEFKSHTRQVDDGIISYARYASAGKLHDYASGVIIHLDGINESLRKERI